MSSGTMSLLQRAHDAGPDRRTGAKALSDVAFSRELGNPKAMVSDELQSFCHWIAKLEPIDFVANILVGCTATCIEFATGSRYRCGKKIDSTTVSPLEEDESPGEWD